MRPLAIAPLPSGAVLVDLASGAVMALNASAAIACSALASGRDPVAALCDAHAIDRATAEADVEHVLAELERPRPAPGGAPIPRSPSGFRLGALEIDASGESIRWLGEADAEVLRAAVPHALALLGLPVLHASAIERGGAIAFVGASGIGKSTLARILAGDRPLADDVLAISRDGCTAFRCEDAIAEWIRAGSLDVRRLRRVWEGAGAPLRAVHLIERGAALVSRPLDPIDAVERLLHNAFAEIPEPRVWKGALESAAAVASSAAVYETTLPSLDELERLAPAHDWIGR